MRKIIDSHAHLGDIFHENRNVSFQTHVELPEYEDRFVDLEESGFTKPLFTGQPDDEQKIIDGGQFRCWQSTLTQLQKELDENEMEGVVLLPVLPNTSFEEYLAASRLEPRILPFTAADFSLPEDKMIAKLKRDIGSGARGLKLHPVLQNVRLTDPKMYHAAEIFGEMNLPVVVHVGIGTYYSADKDFPWNPQYGAMEDFFTFVHELGDQPIIGAHCGAFAKEFIKGVKGMKNVYTDTSFSSAPLVREAVEILGEDQVLYGTDYPFTHEKYNIQVIDDALSDQPIVKEKVFYENIAKLLHL